jgi:hypothetical protein
MISAIRWRIIVLQAVLVLVLGFSAGAGFFASNFTHQQVHDQLAPQDIAFPATQAQGLFPDLQQYAGQQVVNGNQAHAYAEQFIARHLQTIGQGHPYSYWSSLALTSQDPATAAKANGIADTLFKGDTLRTMLNEAWTFWVIGDIAFYAAIALLIATLGMLAALAFEVVEVVRQRVPVNAATQASTLKVHAA